MFEGWGVAVAAGAAVGAIGSAVITSGATKDAAASAAATAQTQEQLQAAQNAQIQKNLAPYQTAGSHALGQLTSDFAPGGLDTQTFTPGDFTKSPEYQGYLFEQKQGQAAINQEAAATGTSLAPETVAALESYNQGLASTNYSNWYDQAYTQWQNQQQTEIQGKEFQASLGESAAAQVGTQTQVGTGNELQALSNASDASIAAEMAGAKNTTQTIGTLTGQLTSPSLLNALNGGSQSGNPLNLGGSTPVAPAGSQLTYDADGNITGSAPITSDAATTF